MKIVATDGLVIRLLADGGRWTRARARERGYCLLAVPGGSYHRRGTEVGEGRDGEGGSQREAVVEKLASARQTALQELEGMAPSELQERKSDGSLRDLGEKPGTDKNLFSGWRRKTVGPFGPSHIAFGKLKPSKHPLPINSTCF